MSLGGGGEIGHKSDRMCVTKINDRGHFSAEKK